MPRSTLKTQLTVTTMSTRLTACLNAGIVTIGSVGLPPSRSTYIQGACPVLHKQTQQASVSVTRREVPPGHEELRSGPSGRASQTEPAVLPLVRQTEYRQVARQGWKQVLHRPSWVQSLRLCAVCKQWISMKGPGAKQHYRLAHPDVWDFRDAAVARCSELGLSDYKAPRTHVARGGAVFQASIAAQWLAQDDEYAGRGGGRSHGGQGEWVQSRSSPISAEGSTASQVPSPGGEEGRKRTIVLPSGTNSKTSRTTASRTTRRKP